MPQHFVTLGCTSCGAKLDIFDQDDRFTCGYCGTEMAVSREGPQVSLHSLKDLLQQVHEGTRRSAAELAIVRLERELEALRAQYLERSEVENTAAGRLAVFGLIPFILGLAMLLTDARSLGLLLLAGGIGLFAIAYRQVTPEPASRDLKLQIRQLEARISEQKQIANG